MSEESFQSEITKIELDILFIKASISQIQERYKFLEGEREREREQYERIIRTLYSESGDQRIETEKS